MDVVDLDETAVGRMILKPGWRWSTDVAPKMGTSTCQVRHLGAAVSGHLHVVVEDGSEMDIQGGDVYEIPPGHDGWVVGDVPWEAVEFASARAGPSEVLVSAVTRDLLDGSGLAFEERGLHELKGLSGARPVFALVRVASPAR